uniref:Uncharacterized protein LOC105044698 isoform X1 n=1 Tax=Elaeis guineensis var. tenera TaxID=51953 RepID=A0A6J0PIH0_ELAGV|nr:uncharacterized protein LOC105044698 isoform X1 [Elaeis guineensis]
MLPLMAEDAEERTSKRRKRMDDRRKLLTGEKVEVLYFDEGLLGSWHLGRVIGCGDCSRLIEYTNLLNDDQSSKLVESIAVSAAIEGASRTVPKYYRGQIRPLPPQYKIRGSDIIYGLCVDALVDDAWWEGVVFDHEAGSEERRVFFPDQGDQQIISVDRLRVTQEWDEVFGEWKPRGKWLLLQVLQAFEEDDGLPVSIREIWYDLRATCGFLEKIKGWTFGTQDVWHRLVSELIQVLWSVVSGTTVSEILPSDELINLPITSNNSLVDDVPCLERTNTQMDGTGMSGCLAGIINSVSSLEPCMSADLFWLGYTERLSQGKYDNGSCSQASQRDGVMEASGGVVSGGGPSRLCDPGEWNTKPESGPKAISDFISIYHTKSLPPYLRKRIHVTRQLAKAHLQAGGWQFRESSRGIKYYVSPDGTRYGSFIRACESWKAAEENADTQKVMICSGATDIPICDDQGNGSNRNFTCTDGKAVHGSASRAAGTWKLVQIDAEYCPEVIALYASGVESGMSRVRRSRPTNLKHENLRLKVKKHLLALGWKIEIKRDKVVRLRFSSPEGKTYYSLCQVCCDLLKGNKKAGQECSADDDLEGNCSSQKRNVSSPAKIHPEPMSLAGDTPVHSWSIKRKNHQIEHSTHAIALFEATEGVRKCNAQTEGSNFSEFVDSDELPDYRTIGAFSSGGYINHSEVNVNCASSGRLMEDNIIEDLKPEYLPEAMTDYDKYMESLKQNGKQDVDVKQLRLNVKKHLLYRGWHFWLKTKKTKQELCYDSPDGKSYHSLATACKAYLESECLENTNVNSFECMAKSKKIKADMTHSEFEHSVMKNEQCRLLSSSTAMASNRSQEASQILHEAEKDSGIYCNSSEFGELGFGKLQLRGVRKKRKRNSSFSFEVLHNRLLTNPSSHSSDGQQSKKRKGRQSFVRQGHRLGRSSSPRVLRSSARSRQLVASYSHQQSAKTVLSWLIDNNVVLPRQKVSYMHKRDGHAMKEGRINRDGIKCMCCRMVFSLAKFEAHAGSSTQRPSANILLQDGRSLLQCQMQMMHDNKTKDFPHVRLKGDYSHYQSDTICSVCQDGGTLMLCDHCPSSFHPSCVGLKDIPEGKWFCPSCRCAICGLSEYNCDMEKFTEKTMLYCDQCEQEYHVGCLREKRLQHLSHCPAGNWFCSKKCSKIFYHLHKFLGKSHLTSVEGLSWTLLRCCRENGGDLEKFDLETMAEHHSKLCIALDVLHECFVTMIEPRTKNDVVADLVFNKESELNRLNFWGFYTMLLERGDELISVATFRVYGEKVAEMPLVGTRIQYRRQGMCRLLMNELEKLLSSLGVQKLLLPAVPQLFETWTTSFGFTKMTSSDRLDLSEYTLLSFQDTTMCQKLLRRTAVLKEPRGNHNQLADISCKSEEQVDCDNYSITSEVAEMVEPIHKSPSLDAGLCALPTGDTREITYQMDAANCLPISSCKDTLVETLRDETNEQTTASVVAGKCEDNCVLVRTSPSTIMEKPVTDVKYKFSGKCYERNGKTGASRVPLVSSIDVRNTCNFKFIYQRRTLTT